MWTIQKKIQINYKSTHFSPTVVYRYRIIHHNTSINDVNVGKYSLGEFVQPVTPWRLEAELTPGIYNTGYRFETQLL